MKPVKIYALLLMGARVEPFLPAVLKGLDRAVDHLVVHDNSGLAQSANRTILEASTLYTTGRATVTQAPFVNFSQARNESLQFLRERLPCDENTWLLSVDCDEVHADGLSFVTREILSALPSEVGVVDGYYYNFILTFDFYNALDRRHNLLVRYNDDLHWTLDVHEHLHGVRGRRLCLPYTFHHYGYIRTPAHIVEKWTLYLELGDRTYSADDLSGMSNDELFSREVDRVMYYRGEYPPALNVLGDRKTLVDGHLESFRALVAARMRHAPARLGAFLRGANYRLRLLWRTMQWMLETRRLSDARALASIRPVPVDPPTVVPPVLVRRAPEVKA